MEIDGRTLKIETVCCYSGDEAEVCRVLMDFFPGIGGNIRTRRAISVAIRQEKSYATGQGRMVFARHAIFKKLEDFFLEREQYHFPHIPRPFGSGTIVTEHGLREMHCYEWSPGSDGFCWVYADAESAKEPIILDEWNEFVSSFAAAGIDLKYDCADPDDGRVSKNIVHEVGVIGNPSRLNRMWQRIDFGSRSVIVSYDQLKMFLKDSRIDLLSVLGFDRVEMLELFVNMLADGGISDYDLGRLEVLARSFRSSTLRHHTANFIGENTDASRLCRVEEGR